MEKKKYESGKLTLEITAPEAGVLCVTWCGTFAELKVPSDLLPFLERCLKLDGQTPSKVQYRIEALEHSNSAMIATLARGLRIVRESCKQVEFFYSKNRNFQRHFAAVMEDLVSRDSNRIAPVSFVSVDGKE